MRKSVKFCTACWSVALCLSRARAPTRQSSETHQGPSLLNIRRTTLRTDQPPRPTRKRCARPSAPAVLILRSAGSGNQLFQLFRQVALLWMKRNAAISCRCAICRGMEIENCISGRHPLIRWMNPSNLTCKHEHPSVLLYLSGVRSLTKTSSGLN